MKGALAPVQTHVPSARPEELAGSEMPPISVEFSVVHRVNITSGLAESMNNLRLSALCINARGRAWRYHQRCVVAF
jgi:hypothetical protein